MSAECPRWRSSLQAKDSYGKNRIRFKGVKKNKGPATAPNEAGITDTGVMRDSTRFLSEGSAKDASRSRLWRSRALIFGLISASTAALLLCPCDCAVQNPHAMFLIAISVLIGCCAAVLVYREMRRRSDITAFLKAASAIAIVVFGVYAEFAVAMYLIAWLARRGR
jgi:hypothetical protein